MIVFIDILDVRNINNFFSENIFEHLFCKYFFRQSDVHVEDASDHYATII